jgi:TonB family protein
MGNKFGRLYCVSILIGLPAVAAWAQDLPAPAEHVQRQADNPLRWIVEAGKIKGRGAAEKPVARGSAAGKSSPRPAAAASSAAAVPAAALATPTPTIATEMVAQAAGAAAPPPPPSRPDELELVSGGKAELPDELWQQLRTDAELVLEFTVNADGSVSGVSVQSSTHNFLDAIAIESLQGWRFKPIRQAQVHGVQLVFHPRD